jgi:hypothetical protein
MTEIDTIRILASSFLNQSIVRSALFVLAGALACCQQSPGAETKQETLYLTPHEIWIVFRENPVAAETLYGDKNLRVIGTIGRIELENSARPIVLLITPEDEYPIRAELNAKAATEAATLQEGDKKVLNCVGFTEFAQAPMLLNCSIIQT